MREEGYTEAQIQAFLAKRPKTPVKETVFAVHPDNVVAVKLLLATASQWRTAPLSTMSKAQIIRTGLEYGALEATARLSGIPVIEPADFDRLRILEAECLKAWSETRK